MYFPKKLFRHYILAAFLTLPVSLLAQDMEWKLVNPSFSATDPDGAGPAKGSVTFTLQMRAINAPIPGINAITTGWSYDDTKAMVPTTPGCSVVSNPANVSISSAFALAGFSYTTVNQCGAFTQPAGTAVLNKRVVGTLDGSGITIGTSFMDVFTVTMWALDTTSKGGYFAINAGAGGSPSPFATYSAADDLANEYVINSLSFSSPITLPVSFASFLVSCKGNASLITWSTEMEFNSSHFIVEKTINGRDWTAIGNVKASGNSSSRQQYQFSHTAKGNAIFRVKEVDLDGKYSYSPIAASNCSNNLHAISVYPVPAHQQLKVNLPSNITTSAQLLLLDATGKKMRTMNVVLASGNNQFEMNLTGLTPGSYLLQMISDHQITDVVNFVKE